MSASGRPLLLAVLHVEAAIRIGHVVVRACARALRPCAWMPLLAAFDFDERADRRFVNRDRDVLVRKLLAVLLVAEPHVEAELFEHVQQQQAVADDGLHLFAKLHRRVLHRALEGEQRLAAFEADAKHAAPAAQLIVVGVEQVVFLQPPPRSGVAPVARIACLASSASRKPSLISRSSIAAITRHYTAGLVDRPRSKGQGRPSPCQRHQSPIGLPGRRQNRRRTNTYIVKHSSGERRKAEVAEHRHLEDLDVAENRHGVDPFRPRPEVPELPQPAADEPADQQVDQPLVRCRARMIAQAEIRRRTQRIDRIEQKDEAEKDRRRQIRRRPDDRQQRACAMPMTRLT